MKQNDQFELEPVKKEVLKAGPVSTEMRNVTMELDQLRVEYEIKSPYHLRIGYINYYPTAGTVNLDGQRKFKHRGVDFLISVLQKEGVIP